MGCDIHSFAEVKNNGKWEVVDDVFPLDDWEKERKNKDFGSAPFANRDYSLFGFLAGVRNYSRVEPVSSPRGLPSDVSDKVKSESDGWGIDGHSHSYLTVSELLAIDYEGVFWNRRVTKQVAPNVWDGAALADEGEGTHIPLRKHLSKSYFDTLEILKTLGKPDDVRVVFWFDD